MVNPQRLPRLPFKSERLGVSVGMLLGDASIAKKYQNNLVLSSSDKEYFNWKSEILQHLGFHKFKTRVIHSGYENGRDGYMSDFRHKSVPWLYKNFYGEQNKRHINPQFIRHLNAYGLALWFMDDGWIVEKGFDFYCISTAAFDERENNIIIKTLDRRFDLRPVIHKDKEYFKLYFGSEDNNGKRFKTLIRPYIHNSMRYKIR